MASLPAWQSGDPIGTLAKANLEMNLRFLNALQRSEQVSYHLRYVHKPNAPTGLYFFVKVNQKKPADAIKQLRLLAIDLEENIFSAWGSYYQFTPLADSGSFLQAFNPLQGIKAIAEISRQLDTQREGVGIFNFLERLTLGEEYFEFLEKQNLPLVLHITAQPTEMRPWERQPAWQTVLSPESQTEHEDTKNTITVSDNQALSVSPPPILPALLHPFEIHCQVAASEESLAASILQGLAYHLSGHSHYAIHQPGNATDFNLARENFVRLLPPNWVYNPLPADTKRLWHLFDIRQTGNVFRIPTGRIQAGSRVLAPKQESEGPIFLGHTTVGQQPISLTEESLRRHVYILGKTGTGKSSLMKNMIISQIKAGHGVGAIDPHGDLIQDILPHIPKSRVDDLILIDPTNTTRSVGVNLFDVSSPEEANLVTQEMIEMMMRLYGEEIFGPRIQNYANMGALTLMDDLSNPGTLLQLPRLFDDEVFRKKKLSKLANPMVQAFWEQEYKSTLERERSEMIPYFRAKFAPFYGSLALSRILGQSKSTISFSHIVNSRSILLVNLAKGFMTQRVCKLLGMIILSRLMIASMQKIKLPPEKRVNFTLYIDEFQNLLASEGNHSFSASLNENFNMILSEGRKFGLSLVLANQFFGQVPQSVTESIAGNVGSLISLRLGYQDAKKMLREFGISSLSVDDIIHLNNFNGYMYLAQDEKKAEAFSFVLQKPEKLVNPQLCDLLRKFSAITHGRPVHEIDQEVTDSLVD